MADNKSQFAQIEEQIFDTWEKEKTFQKSVDQRKGQPMYSFYDGPPFANGLPHFGHSLVTSIKDSMLRYKTMRGYYVPRRNGWDCHGLPVEYAIEKEFGISGKRQIMELGLEKFNAACSDSIFKYKDDWERLLKRLGRWSDYDNYYATVDTNYTESVWWALSQINKKGLLYKGFKSTAYCPRCETPLSNFEVNEGYKDNVEDPSLYVKFRLEGEYASLLAWTTTPWSLPGNAAVAVNPNAQYVYVKFINDDGGEEIVILAKSRLEVLDEQDYQVVREVSGSELAGKAYQPLFKTNLVDQADFHDLYHVVEAPFVSTEDGTGVLHVAPAYGEDDLNLTAKYKLPVLSTVDHSGHLTDISNESNLQGLFFKNADRPIIEFLTTKGAVFAAETTHHTYPFCWRCETPLLYYAINSWFIKVSEIRSQLLNTAKDINWTPKNIKTGRFGKWLEGARDWAISRNRYWGAPMPIWVNEADESDYIVVESYEQLRDLVGNKELKLDDVHRPYIDNVVISKDGKTYRRVEEVLDCWFESGCMSIGQQHYPFENQEEFKLSFPADFIIEGLDQTRLWFYVQHVVNTILFDSAAYKNVVVNGIILAADGQKLSKRLKNYPPLEEVFDNEGADSLRLLLLSSTQATQTADYLRFNRDALKDLNRNVLGTLLNSFRFFKMYADIDKWEPHKNGHITKSDNVLDKWITSRLNETIKEVTDKADEYKIAHAILPIFDLIDDTSNWYIRRSRRRFWKSEDDKDKNEAYVTLWYVLTRICQLLAPWAPFISDYIWKELTGESELASSVHLSDWPEAEKLQGRILEDMNLIRTMINQGLKERANAGIKVRQPLAGPVVKTSKPISSARLKQILEEELNVKQATYIVEGDEKAGGITMNFELSNELKSEGYARELIRFVQNARKKAGLNVDDRIDLSLRTENDTLRSTIDEFRTTIMAETLALNLTENEQDGFSEAVKVDDMELKISLKKAQK